MRGKDLLRELQRTVDELAVLNEIGKALTASLDIGEVMHVILAKVSELLKPRNWSLLLKDPATSELYFHAAVGAGSDTLLGMRIKPGEGIAGWVAQHNQPLLVNDVHADPRFASRFDQASRFHTQSILCVPLAFKERTLGVIELVNGEGDGGFSEEDLKILGTVAEFSAIAIENARNFHKVQELTVLDDHTGLFNSRHLRRSLESEVVRATRFGHPVSLIFFDLDHFKRVNDTHGHQAGSQVLHEVGSLLLKTLRSTDVPVRYGGDEFVILMPETSKDQAVAAARRIGAEIARQPFLADRPYGPLKLTASLGVASFPDDAREPDDLLLRADEAMYRVKATQRGGVFAAPPSQPPSEPAPARNATLTAGVSSEP
ncbi:MAG TPA: sensor domain-containing diguanylate cyclase [Myxococcales bacterium]|jgi:diguanylate cyclase (GGDEF)-like protein|nr:sensor domain-containing diguanylate cyclase [Myxococcales bacterium]